MRFRPLITCLLTLATFATTAAAAQACDETWTGNAGDGSWTTANNWSPAQIPQSTDAVCITKAGTYTVTLAANGDVASLTLGASSGIQTLDVQGLDYNQGGEIRNGTTLTLNDPSTITSNGELILDSTSGGAAPGTNPAGGYAALNTDTLTNSGKIATQSEDPSWPAYFAGSLTDEASASLDVNSGTFSLPTPSGSGYGNSYAYSVTNDGSVAVASNAAVTLGTTGSTGDFVNNGTVVNTGTITGVGSMTWTQSGGSESGNAVALEAGAWLVDSVGAGSFLFNYESGALSGTIPAGQTVTVQGEVFNSGGENYNSTSLALNANNDTSPVTNDGTLVLDAPGSGSASGGSTFLTNGALDNNGTVVSQVEDSNWSNTLQAGIVNGSSGNIDLNSGTLTSNGGLSTNDGTVTVAPGALWSFNEGGTLANAASGTIVPEIASAASYGSFQLTSPCCAGPGAITAGGTLSPKLIGGFTPTANEEFPIVALDGGTFSGKFGSVGSGFAADYTKETASPAFVGVVYGQSAAAAPAPALSVGKISASGTKLSVKLSCGKGAACSGVKIAGTVTEHLKRGKVKAVTASAHAAAKKKTTKVVVVASATAAVAAGASKTISIRLNATGRKLLARFHKLTVLTTVRIGAKTVRSVKVVVHAPKKR
jgi:hypothetical protein